VDSKAWSESKSVRTHTHTHTHTLLAKSNELIHLKFELHYTPCEIIINY